MLEVKITITATEIAAAINNLANALNKNVAPHTICRQYGENNHQINNVGVLDLGSTQKAAKIPAVKENPTTETAPVRIAQTSGAVAPTAVPDPAPVTVAMTAPTAPVKSYTVDDLSCAGATLIDQGKMPQLLELLKKYGVQAVTQLDASQYPAFVEDMKALGAAL